MDIHLCMQADLCIEILDNDRSGHLPPSILDNDMFLFLFNYINILHAKEGHSLNFQI